MIESWVLWLRKSCANFGCVYNGRQKRPGIAAALFTLWYHEPIETGLRAKTLSDLVIDAIVVSGV